MSESPWPEEGGDKLLFILDASHAVDRELLENWIESGRGDYSPGQQAAQVVVPIGREPENIPTLELAHALDVADETEIVPLRVVWINSVDGKNTTPRLRDLLLGNPRRPGLKRAQKMLASNPDGVQLIAAAHATLGELRQRLTERQSEMPSQTELVDFVASQAGLALDIAERRLQGGRYKVPRQVAKNLAASKKFNVAISELSTELGKTEETLLEEAAVIMKELISIPRTFWLDVMAALNRTVIALGYESDIVIDQQGLERFRQITRENPAALLWTHKTYVDGFVMNSVFFENDFPAPHILGGVNMAFAGLGYVARRAGAIFIRRSFQDNPLYKMVLRQYIGYLMEKRFPLTWAFEGTRSRVGKLMPPRYGLLKYVVEAAHATDARNLHIIPISVSYDLIGDVPEYASEQSGAIKQPESLRWFMGYLRLLRQPMGRVYVDFGEPVVLDHAPSVEDPLVLSKIAFQVGVECNRVTPLTLPSLTAMILLGTSPRALTAAEMAAEMSELIAWSVAREIRVTSVFRADNEEQLLELAEVLVNSGLLTRYDEGPELVYALEPAQHGIASYYRNTIIHFFVNKAIAELSLMHVVDTRTGLEEFWQQAERLRDLFKFEFFYAPSEEFRDEVRAELCRYDETWETGLAGAQEAQELLDKLTPLVSHATLLHYVEAYRIVADVIARLDDDASLDEKACVDQCLSYGKQAWLQRRISSEASIGKLLFINGYKLMANLQLVESTDPSVGQRRRALSQELRLLQRQLEHIRSMALPRLVEV